MAASPSQIQSVLESFLTSAIQKMVEDTKLNDISDIYLQADAITRKKRTCSTSVLLQLRNKL